MTKEEFEDLDLDRSIVRFKNIHGEHIHALVVSVSAETGKVHAVQFKDNMPFCKHYSELHYVGTPGTDSPYLTDYL